MQESSHLTPTGYLESIGFWTPRVVAAHGVWVNDDDIAILKRRDVGVSHNPESNMKLASGVAPVPKYLAAVVKLGLGTDGPRATTTSTCSRRCGRQRSCTNRGPAIRAPCRPPGPDWQRWAERAFLGFRCYHRSANGADVIVVGTNRARQTPLYDPISQLVYATHGDDVKTTIVNGRVLMRDRKVATLDEPAVLADARRLAVQVRQAVTPQ